MLDWDRSHDWVLRRFWNDQTCVAIRFKQSPPSFPDLIALRQCLPQFRVVAPAELRAKIGQVDMLELGTFSTREARRLLEAAQGQRFEVITEDASFVTYLPFDRTKGRGVIASIG